MQIDGLSFDQPTQTIIHSAPVSFLFLETQLPMNSGLQKIAGVCVYLHIYQ